MFALKDANYFVICFVTVYFLQFKPLDNMQVLLNMSYLFNFTWNR
jgi:hypothetical protein